jgi:hypothetical protein
MIGGRYTIVLLIAAVIGPAFARSAQAQSPVEGSSVEVAADAGFAATGFSVPPLPDPSQGQQPVVVTGTTAQLFRSIIPEPLYPIVRAGALSLAVLSHVPWRSGVGDGKWREAPLDDCLAAGNPGQSRGWSPDLFPCGSRITIERSEKEAGKRYLVNAERAAVATGLSRLELRVLSTGAVVGDAAVRIERLAPRLLQTKEQPKGAVLWRERVTWLEPKPITSSGLFTVRFVGSDEDMFFQRSSISGRFRQLTGSNRGDEVLGLPLAADDLSVWSSKIEWVESATVLGVRKMLVGVVGQQRTKLERAEPGCFESEMLGNPRADILDVWASNLLFVPRDVVQVEAISGDPFSLIGKVHVFIDTETMLPVMKIVYDRAGQQKRVILGGILGLTEESTALQLSIIGPIATLGTGGRTAVLKPELVMVCNGFSQSLNEGIFDLRGVMPSREAAGSSASAQSSASAAPVEVDER